MFQLDIWRVFGGNIHVGKVYVDWLEVSEWLCSFSELQEGKNSCFCLYFCLQGRIQAIFVQNSPKYDLQSLKSFQRHMWGECETIVSLLSHPYSLRKRKVKKKTRKKQFSGKFVILDKILYWNTEQSLTKKRFRRVEKRWKMSQKCRETFL